MPFKVKKSPQVDGTDFDSLKSDVRDLSKYCDDEFAEVASALQNPDPIKMWTTVPPKPRTGFQIYADGTHNDPGSGEGMYFYNSAGLWVPMFSGLGVVTADRTYYVRTDGSDSNNGRADNAGGAFLTIQKALDVVATLFLNNHNITIQVRAGTYTSSVVSAPWIGRGTVTLVGDTTTPSNCVIAATSTHAILVKNKGSRLTIQGFKITNSDTNTGGLSAHDGAQLSIGGKMEFGTCALYTLFAINGGQISIDASVTYAVSGTGGGAFWWSAGLGSTIVNNAPSVIFQFSQNVTVTSAFVYCTDKAMINTQGTITWDLATFTKTVTGKKYNVDNLALIQTYGGAVFPGSIAGTGTNPSAAPWGLYL
jgi:hypothetical protein